jgi:hypothetical protein
MRQQCEWLPAAAGRQRDEEGRIKKIERRDRIVHSFDPSAIKVEVQFS